MKKIYVLLAVLLVLMWPAAAFAEGDSMESTVTLSIDSANVYAGMDKAYKDGYTPVVANGTVTIVLPLVASGSLAGNVITATPNLGDTMSSPFVFANYQKTVTLEGNAYLVRFDLPLASGRTNGAYPVSIDVQATAADGSPVMQTFTVHVTITDGKPAPTQPRPEKQKPQPKIIVSGYQINPSSVTAGEEFTATITLLNTSEKQGVQNMAVTVSCDSPSLALQNESSTFYLGKLAKGKTVDIELKYKTDLETLPARYNIMLAMDYDNSEAMTLSSSGTVPVAITQPVRMQIELPKIPTDVNAGDTLPLSFQVMNLSRSAVYNVRVTLDAAGLIPSGTAFIGNMEAGSAMTADMDVFIGTKNMSEGYESDDKYGYTSGIVTLTYEDENGQEYTEESEIYTSINPPVISAASTEPVEEPKTAGQWWISIVIGVIVIGALAGLLIARKKKRSAHEDI